MNFSANCYYYYFSYRYYIPYDMSPYLPLHLQSTTPRLIKPWRCRPDEAEIGAIGPTRDINLMANSAMIIGDGLGYRDDLYDINEYSSLLIILICCSFLFFS